MRFSDEEIRRYSRQLLLPEVGGVGQERLRAGRAVVASEVEALYLAAAGLGTIQVPTEAIAEAVRALNPLVEVELDAPQSSPPIPDVGPEAVVASAERALATLRAALAL